MPNRLAQSASPYLLQHQNNPVEWWPWCEEAFAEARRRDVPVFLSVGYSTCHWCHVMEHESFEDAQLAAYLNANFVAVKLDREERPDLDAVYMAALQGVSGSGGWPMSLMLDHERRPFFCATYLPPQPRFGRPSFRMILERVSEMWGTRRAELLEAAQHITESLRGGEDAGGVGAGPLPDAATLDRCLQQLAGRFEPRFGGFGSRPKFPTPHVFQWLLREHARTGNRLPLDMTLHSLRCIAAGGIHDHVGGGMHRYSTDEAWLLPHFEKMLYDQALHALAYLEAYQVSGDERFAETARGVFRYCLRDLRDAGGGFWSAEDADSEGEEGKFYVWTKAELEEVLGAAEGQRVAEKYRCVAEGNFTDEASGHRSGANILHLQPGAEPPEVQASLARLLAARAKRVRPSLDDKVQASWNGLMLSALAPGARVLGDRELLDAAEHCAEFVLKRMSDGHGGLIHSVRGEARNQTGLLEDYAFVARGLLDLYQARFEPHWLAASLALVREMQRRFEDSAHGGFFTAQSDATDLLIRQKEVYDGAEPSGNSVACEVLLRLGRLTGDAALLASAEGVLRCFSARVRAQPQAHTQLMCALSELVSGGVEVTIAVPAGAPEAEVQAMLAATRSGFAPSTLVVVRRDEWLKELSAALPTVASQAPLDGKVTAYVCRSGTCSAPVTQPERVASLIKS